MGHLFLECTQMQLRYAESVERQVSMAAIKKQPAIRFPAVHNGVVIPTKMVLVYNIK